MEQTHLMLEQSISWWRDSMAGSLTIDNINGKVISSSPVATESQVIGVGQTWQDVTASRVSGTTYTNTTGKPIQVYVNGTGVGSPVVVVNGVQIASATTNYYVPPTFIVPNGATYSVTVAISKWSELR